MKLYVIFGQRIERYEGECAPEVIDCWDENSAEENPDGYQDAIDKAKALTVGKGAEFLSVIVAEVSVNGGLVERALREPLRLVGSVTMLP